MTEQPIVVGFDDSPASRAALEWALRDAGGRHCDVLLVHAAKSFPPILPGPGDYIAYPSQITEEVGKAILHTAAKNKRDSGAAPTAARACFDSRCNSDGRSFSVGIADGYGNPRRKSHDEITGETCARETR